MPQHPPAHHLEWSSVTVGGRRVNYGVGGFGRPVLFIHGWALGSRSYKRALKRLMALGCRVYAPALPGLGGSSSLPAGQDDLEDYARWLDGFADAVGIGEPALVAGHSLGGAVATRFAHDHPDHVAHLVLINSVGAAVWKEVAGEVRYLAERPLWGWVADFSRDIATSRGLRATVRAIVEDAVPNVVRDPVGMWRAATLARRADLRAELERLRGDGVAVTAVSSQGDLIIPGASFAALCQSLGVEGRLVPGRHSWLLGEPDLFGRLMADIIESSRPAPHLPELRPAANG